MKILTVVGLTAVLASTPEPPTPSRSPVPSADGRASSGTTSRWTAVNVTVVEPEKPLPGRPWAWRGEFFGAFPNADVELVKRGWHLAYVGVPDLFGSPEAVARWEKVYDVLVNRHQLSPKPGLIGLSRGALYCMAWAAAHPDRTLAVYLDNGVCDFKSWPGGKPKGLGTGVGSPEEWAKLLKAYGFKDDQEAIASKLNPVDRLKPLADAKVPILLVYGDKDRGVPHLENSEVVYEQVQGAGRAGGAGREAGGRPPPPRAHRPPAGRRVLRAGLAGRQVVASGAMRDSPEEGAYVRMRDDEMTDPVLYLADRRRPPSRQPDHGRCRLCGRQHHRLEQLRGRERLALSHLPGVPPAAVRALGLDVANGGIAGEISGNGLGQVEDYLGLFPNARYFIVGYGTNDLGMWPEVERTSPRIIENLDRMVRAIRDGGRYPILLNVPYANESMFPRRVAEDLHRIVTTTTTA